MLEVGVGGAESTLLEQCLDRSLCLRTIELGFDSAHLDIGECVADKIFVVILGGGVVEGDAGVDMILERVLEAQGKGNLRDEGERETIRDRSH